MIIFCEGYMCTGHIELIAFSHHRKIFQHFLHHENEFHDIYIYIYIYKKELYIKMMMVQWGWYFSPTKWLGGHAVEVSSGEMRGAGVNTYQPIDSLHAPPHAWHNIDSGER